MLKLTPINIVIAIFTFEEIKHNSWYNLPYGEYNWQIFCYFEPEKKGRSYWLKVVVLTNKMWVASDRRILQKFW